MDKVESRGCGSASFPDIEFVVGIMASDGISGHWPTLGEDSEELLEMAVDREKTEAAYVLNPTCRTCWLIGDHEKCRVKLCSAA